MPPFSNMLFLVEELFIFSYELFSHTSEWVPLTYDSKCVKHCRETHRPYSTATQISKATRLMFFLLLSVEITTKNRRDQWTFILEIIFLKKTFIQNQTWKRTLEIQIRFLDWTSFAKKITCQSQDIERKCTKAVKNFRDWTKSKFLAILQIFSKLVHKLYLRIFSSNVLHVLQFFFGLSSFAISAYGATKKEAKQKAAERVMKVLLKTPIDKIRVKNELPIDVVRIKSGLPIDEARVKNELPIDEVQVKQKLPIDESRKGSEPQIDIKTVENQILQKRAELDKLLELHWKLLQPTIEKLEAEEVFDVEDHPMWISVQKNKNRSSLRKEK